MSIKKNRGDTLYIELDYTVNGEPLKDGEWDEIEFSFGENRFLLSDGTVEWNPDAEKYCIWVDQSQSFNLNTRTEYQLRLRKGRDVISTKTKRVTIGDSISREVI